MGKVEGRICEGTQLHVGGKDVEVDRALPRSEYLSGACFRHASSVVVASPFFNSARVSKPFVPLKMDAMKPLHKPSAGYERKGIPLQPVDLISTMDNSPARIDMRKGDVQCSHWTANW